MKFLNAAVLIFLAFALFMLPVSATRIFVQVNDSATHEPIHDAQVSVKVISTNEVFPLSTGSDGRTTGYAELYQSYALEITTSATDHQSATTPFTVNPNLARQIVQVNLVPGSTSGPQFVKDEKMVFDFEGCGTGWTETASFTAGGRTVKHCVFYSNFIANEQYVNYSYFAGPVFDSSNPCPLGGATPSAGLSTVTMGEGTLTLCVSKKSISSYNTESAVMEVSVGASCPSQFTQTSLTSVDGVELRHCIKATLASPTPSGCTVSNPQWIDGLTAQPLTEAFGTDSSSSARAPGDTVYPLVILNDACRDKVITFNIYRGTDTTDSPLYTFDSIANEIMQAGTFAGQRGAYASWNPQWSASQSIGSISNAPVTYTFIAQVRGENVKSGTSPILTVKQPPQRCDSNADCASDVPFCNSEGRCVSRQCVIDDDCPSGQVCDSATGRCSGGSCQLSNLRWTEKGAPILAGEWFEERKMCGTAVDLIATASDISSCSDSEISFVVQEEDLFVDDTIEEIPLVSNRFAYFDYEPPKLPSGFSNLFEGDRIEVYFYPKINGVEYPELASPILTLTKPRDLECASDRDCDGGLTCNECGSCGVGSEECDLNSDCSEGLYCDSTAHLCVECVEADDCSGDNMICSDNQCVKGPVGCALTTHKWIEPAHEEEPQFLDESLEEITGSFEGYDSDDAGLATILLIGRNQGAEGSCGGRNVIVEIYSKTKSYGVGNLDGEQISAPLEPFSSSDGIVEIDLDRLEWKDNANDNPTRYYFKAWMDGYPEYNVTSAELIVNKPTCSSTNDCETGFQCKESECVASEESGSNFLCEIPILGCFCADPDCLGFIDGAG